MSRQAHPLLVLTVLAAGAITAGRAVGYDGAQATVAGQKVLGVAETDVADGKHGAVATAGTTIVESGGAIAKGDALRVDANGRAVPAAALAVADPTVDAGAVAVTSSAANGDILTQGAITGGILPQYVFADALEAATGAGEFIEVRLR